MKSKEILPESERLKVETEALINIQCFQTYKALLVAEDELDEKEREIAELKELLCEVVCDPEMRGDLFKRISAASGRPKD